MKIKKRKKSKRQRGQTTYGRGARKKGMGSGHRGGKGMAGTGKRADHKKTLINKLYGNTYFGKQGITSKSTKKRVNKVINLENIEKNINKLLNKNKEVELKDYKILGNGELKTKITIIAKQFSKSAKEKIEKIGGKAVVFQNKSKINKQKTNVEIQSNEKKKLLKKLKQSPVIMF